MRRGQLLKAHILSKWLTLLSSQPNFPYSWLLPLEGIVLFLPTTIILFDLMLVEYLGGAIL